MAKFIDSKQIGKIKLYYAAQQDQLNNLDENNVPIRAAIVIIEKAKCIYNSDLAQIQITIDFQENFPQVCLNINTELTNIDIAGQSGYSFEFIKLKKILTNHFIISGQFKFNESNDHKWLLIGKFHIRNIPIDNYLPFEDKISYDDF